jgi:hypothetical protein
MILLSKKGANMRSQVAMDKFMELVMPVTETGCWLWLGETQKEYGRIQIDGEQVCADMLSWEAKNGRIAVGQRLKHKCNVRCCVNPEHLSPI